ncbi:TetR/AcrR family transcriptional regulator [Phytomonospora endophytica]|uniref:AcrR family transcriptional regulator n=1 Tax=Phytomonospora endophytica TaxID=714109 RepID=A0A841FQW3_9ACTN|nr:TetR/AcrR family transcriptional regulator [Phytomonospora endophytica]MBB6035657.1 AcrR family transcriptional regulator [Phytomonospora endophytica]GIG69665.1 hypothetical protein Pen01_59600 [Phytomonospora endophytica]
MTGATPRNARGRRTREQLLAAAERILDEQGFTALTMSAVAEAAGISRRGIYLHFASRSELIGALYDHVAEKAGRAASLERVWARPDGASMLDEWAAHLARYHTKVTGVDRAMRAVRDHDADAADHRRAIVANQSGGTRRIITAIHGDGRLAPGWTVDTAADMLGALISTDLVDGLLTDRDWSEDELAEHLALLFRRTFLR